LGLYALLAVFFLVLLADWGFRQQGSTAPADASRVYCLAPAHTGGLVTAAVSLGLAAPGSTTIAMHVNNQVLSLDKWRTGHVSDFERACDAYAEANMSGQAAPAPATGGIQALLDILLPVIAGAVLTMGIGTAKDASDQRRAQAAELRTGWHAFRSAAETFVAQCLQSQGGLPPTDDVDAKRRALEATLREVRDQHGKDGKAPVTEGILQGLDGELGTSVALNWSGDKLGRARQVRASLDTFGPQVEKVAGALERKIWPSRNL
jgi:hypothetical protein